ncbi:MAG: hypothetical protein IPJ21_03130 [Sterolibacteriaceae bacterium]|nr:hypothetical protein [Sterolibacteriaceae bacterium]MBK9086650.1 hypothetical protein [Sterolibacteriaceae bacterium]
MSGTKSIPDWIAVNPDTRRFPNGGLSVSQICSVIRDVGLEAFLMGTMGKIESGVGKSAGKVPVREIVNAATYAYVLGGIPILMVVRLWEQAESSPENQIDLGIHAMTVTGFSLGQPGKPKLVRHGRCEIALKSSRIDKLYVHDDQIGPFARTTWHDEKRLSTSWYYLQKRKVLADPDCMIIPLAPKIRIPYEAIERAVVALNEVVRYYINRKMANTVEWDIRLVTVNRFKSEILADSFVKSSERERLATKHMPKHLWLAGAWIADTNYPARKSIEFVVDATAIKQQGGLVDVITRDDTMAACFISAFSQEKIDEELKKIESMNLGAETLVRQIQSYFSQSYFTEN